MVALKDRSGQKFGWLTCIAVVGRRGKIGAVEWLCYCDCGGFTTATVTSLVSGCARSCGCWNEAKPKPVSKNHGLSKTPEYGVWQRLRRRAEREGIPILPLWNTDARDFIRTVGERPSRNHKIALVVAALGFIPGNVFWWSPPEWTKARDRVKSAKWRQQNKDHLTKYREANKEKIRDRDREYRRKWREENREAYRERMRRWSGENPEARAAHSRTRKARVRGAKGTHTAEDVAELKVLQRNTCAYCPQKLNDCYHVDHITPLSRGGSNSRENLQLTCPGCNMSKSARDPLEFAQSLGRLL